VDFSQILNLGNIPSLVIICVAGVIIIAVLGFILQFVGTFFGVIGGTFQLFTDLISGGPVVWCGCLVAIFALGICGIVGFFVASALGTCDTAQAVNLCSLFGR
jgi:hypothetical protein